MPHTRRSHRRVGAGYQTSQQFFNPDVLPPHVRTGYNFASTAPTGEAIRPVLSSTFKGGRRGRRSRSSTRRARGGFSPSIMGSFVANAQTAIVPLAFYAAYHGFVPKKGAKKTRKSRRSRSSRR